MGWTPRVDIGEEIKLSKRRKSSRAWIVSQRAMEEIVITLRRPDPQAHQELAQALVKRLGEAPEEGT